MQTVFIQFIYLILIILGLVMLANKLKLAYPIILVLGGLALSFASRFSNIDIDPEMVFFIFLPPLLYEAAWQTSWKQFWKWRRIITSFAFPVVIITSCVVAYASVMLIPGFTLALGFLLGGIVSPPDAISATTIMRRVKVPKAILGIIEGESLLNDASSLIVFRFALATVMTSQFSFSKAAGSFFLVISFGVLIGLAVGLIFYAITRWLPTTPGIEIVLSLVAPYCMYYFAEHYHVSGVLSVVSGGLFLSLRRQTMLSYQGRLQGEHVWTSLVFVLNGVVFLLIGLQLPSIINQLGGISVYTATWYGLVISFILIVSRLLCFYGAVPFTRFMSHFITVQNARPGWKAPLVGGWAGMRGVVSLAAALSIPLLGSNGEAFPFRNLILFITFVVILFTLVVQGLTLPWLIRKIKLDDIGNEMPEDRQELIIQKKLAHYTLEYLDKKYAAGSTNNEHLENLRARLNIDLRLFNRELDETERRQENSLHEYMHIYLGILDHQRAILKKMNTHAEFDDELIRKYLSLTDMEEFKLREKLAEGVTA